LSNVGDSPDDPLVLLAILDEKRRDIVDKGIKQWRSYRAEITNMLKPSANMSTNARQYATRLSEILRAIEPKNGDFIKALSEELVAQN
jgi:hypothetical protein